MYLGNSRDTTDRYLCYNFVLNHKSKLNYYEKDNRTYVIRNGYPLL